MRSTFLRPAKFLALSTVLVCVPQTVAPQNAQQQGGDFSQNAQAKKLPTDVILVKGAWSNASDSTTPVPEGGSVTNGLYSNPYLGLTYPLPPGWTQKYAGPPPSGSGYYVLAQIRPGDAHKGTSRGSILIGAQDLFFTLTPATNALELINYTRDKLQADYKVERAPAPATIANRSFVRFDYFSPVAELHWYILATQIRCHMVQFILTGHDTKMLESLIQEMDKMKLPADASPILGTGGEDVPACVKDYARNENIIERVDPVFIERRFNSVPVRIIISKEGKVKHIHFLSAFPDQAKLITEALWQWRFKPYLSEGQPVEVETGIMFGGSPRAVTSSAATVANE